MGNLEAVQMLLEAKVKIDPRNDISKTPMHLAAEKGHDPLVVTVIFFSCTLYMCMIL